MYEIFQFDLNALPPKSVGNGAPKKYPFAEMKRGDAIFVPTPEGRKREYGYAASNAFGRKHKVAFATRQWTGADGAKGLLIVCLGPKETAAPKLVQMGQAAE